jgi:aminomethyltransferase
MECASEEPDLMFRNSVLNDRHRALGSDLSGTWNGMPVPEHYLSCAREEIAAVRYRAGLIDISAHKLVNVSGSDATAFLNYLLTSDISKIAAGQSQVSNVVDDAGALIDDVIVYCDGPDKFRLSHGSGTLEDVMRDHVKNYDATFVRDDDTHVLSFQGPLARDVLQPHTPLQLNKLPYFTHHRTALFGHTARIARAGFFGENGFEIFCAAAEAGAVWDSILAAGRESGVIPVSWACLEIARIEAGLLFFPFEMRHADTTPWEVNAGWTVDLTKPEFRGRNALIASQGKERTFIAGLEVLSDAAVMPLTQVRYNGAEAGIVTSAAFSWHLMKSLALAQLVPPATKLGTELELVAGPEVYKATVVQLPFYDPMRLRTRTEIDALSAQAGLPRS